MKKDLQTQWGELCNQYLLEFCNKHDYTLEPFPWVGDNPGTIAYIGDICLSMENIRYDIDNDIPEDKFEKWYWKNLEIYELTNLNYMNYESYCKGAPDYWTEERMNNLRVRKRKIAELTEDLNKTIDDIKHNKDFY